MSTTREEAIKRYRMPKTNTAGFDYLNPGPFTITVGKRYLTRILCEVGLPYGRRAFEGEGGIGAGDGWVEIEVTVLFRGCSGGACFRGRILDTDEEISGSVMWLWPRGR